MITLEKKPYYSLCWDRLSRYLSSKMSFSFLKEQQKKNNLKSDRDGAHVNRLNTTCNSNRKFKKKIKIPVTLSVTTYNKQNFNMNHEFHNI
jgi:hypothetical protein